eukprot:619380-Hanusia_phi.AAC.2
MPAVPQVNHLSHHLLFSLLQPELRKSASMGGPDSRVLFLTCGLSLFGEVDMADLTAPKSVAGAADVAAKLRRFSASKLCNVLFVRELARGGGGIAANAIDPGLAFTGHYRHFLPPILQRLLGANDKVAAALARIFQVSRRHGGDRAHNRQVKPAEAAAAGAVWLLTSDEVEGITGEYFVQDPLGIRNPRYLTQLPQQVKDEEMAKKLWQFCEECLEKRK